MESLLQKWGWVAHLLLIAIVAVLAATAVNEYIAIQLAPYTVPELPEFAKETKAAKRTKRAPRARSYANSIVSRCLFECEEETEQPQCPDGCPEGEVCRDGTCVPSDPNANIPSELPVASDLGVKLLGAMVADGPEFSVALFSDPDAKATYILSVGDPLMGEAEIVDIRRDRVIIRRNNRLEYVKLEDSLGGAPTLTSAAAKLPPGATDLKRTPRLPIKPDDDGKSSGSAKKKPQATAKVKKVGENEFELDRAAVNAELSDPKKLAQGAKIIPNYRDGKRQGIKLVGIRSSSVYSQLGIESGDVVKSVNGVTIKNQAHALELLQKLKGSDSATIEVERRGQSRKMKYKVK